MIGLRKPLMIELFAGLHGWGEGAIAEGYRVVGFDVVDMCAALGIRRPAGIDLVLEDVLTLHGSQFRNAAVIVASPPCQAYSWMAMPWSLAKREAAWQKWQRDSAWWTDRSLNDRFDACFRIAKEAGVPLVVENVKGAQPWVGRAQAHFGSYYLWGDVHSVGGAIVGPVPRFGETLRAEKRGSEKHNPDGTEHGQGSWFKIADSKNRGAKNNGGSWFAEAHNTTSGHGQNPDGRKVPGWRAEQANGTKCTGQKNGEEYAMARGPVGDGVKQEGSGAEWFDNGLCKKSSKSDSRKAASAQIAKIPFALASYIARIFYPNTANAKPQQHSA
jgi:hypothetical protein